MPISWSWTAGKRIQKLPKAIQPLAIIYRNIIHRPVGRLTGGGEEKYPEARIEMHRKLALGVQYVCEADVEGDIAEFGSRSGKSAARIARALSEFDHYQEEPKKLRLFDSFKGLPKAESDVDKESPHVKSGIWREGSEHGSKEELNRRCAKYLPEERIIVYDGWFRDTLPLIPEGTKFSMLNIDCNLYQSTIEVMEYCFSKGLIQEGTAIFFNGWNPNRASPNLGERRAWSEVVSKFGVSYSDCGEYGWGGRKFIVHSYQRRQH